MARGAHMRMECLRLLLRALFSQTQPRNSARRNAAETVCTLRITGSYREINRRAAAICNFAFVKRLVTSAAIAICFSKIALRVETEGRNERLARASSRLAGRANESLVRFIRDVHEKKFAERSPRDLRAS